MIYVYTGGGLLFSASMGWAGYTFSWERLISKDCIPRHGNRYNLNRVAFSFSIGSDE